MIPAVEENLAAPAVSLLRRGFRFYLVGAFGIGVQLGALALLKAGLHLHYAPATALAVECAVLHNFLWHEFFTWSDRSSGSPGAALRRLATFNLTTGLISIGGNVLLMRLLVGELGLHYVVANLATIASCSLANFLVSDRAVFRPPPLLGFNGQTLPDSAARNG